MSGWHGWQRDGDADYLAIELLPMRKSVALVRYGPGVGHILAYFRSEADAREAMLLIDRLVER